MNYCGPFSGSSDGQVGGGEEKLTFGSLKELTVF